MPTVFSQQEVEVDGSPPRELSAAISQQTNIKTLPHSIQSVAASRLQRRCEANFALFRRRHVRNRVGTEDRSFGISHAFRIERGTFTGAPVKTIGLLADISL